MMTTSPLANGTREVRSPTIFGPYTGVTYYDLPAIKPSHYGWLITFYFYIGGIASASQFLATVVDLFGSEADRSLARAGRYLALLGGLVSPPLLILDLKTPLRWYNMLRIFRKTSAMSVGSWALSLFGLFSGLAAAGQALEDFLHWRAGRWIARLAGIPAALSAGMVAIYTGTLLAATNIPLWASAFPYLSSLFASSAASTAAAALTFALPKAKAETRRKLEFFALLSGLFELFFAARVQRHWQREQVTAPLRVPAIGLGWRVGVLGVGISLPILLHLLGLFGGQRTEKLHLPGIAATAALIGGFVLRAVFVFGGKPSAQAPRDYFHLTR